MLLEDFPTPVRVSLFNELSCSEFPASESSVLMAIGGLFGRLRAAVRETMLSSLDAVLELSKIMGDKAPRM